MLECQRCQHDVICEYALLEKEQRFWLDLDQDVLWSTSCCQSLREIAERWSALLGGSVGLRTINERINQIELLAQQSHKQSLQDVPDVVHFDGIWMTLVEQGETIKPDKRKRARHKRKGRRVVVLVALGFYKDGRREILDWEITKSEEHSHWGQHNIRGKTYAKASTRRAYANWGDDTFSGETYAKPQFGFTG